MSLSVLGADLSESLVLICFFLHYIFFIPFLLLDRFFTTLIMKLMLQAPMMPHQKISITAHVAINWIQNMVHFHRAPTLQFKSAMEEMMSTSPFHSSFQVDFEKEKTVGTRKIKMGFGSGQDWDGMVQLSFSCSLLV